MADDSSELALSHQEPRANPPLDLITRLPALDVPANRLHDGKRGLDHVGAAERAAELIGDTQLVNGERFFHAFFQAARCARIQFHQLAMQPLQSALGFRVIDHGVGVLQFLLHVGLVFVGKVIH